MVADGRSGSIEAIYGAEGTARLGLTLERLLAGLDTLGVKRTTARQVIRTVVMDSVPPLRTKAKACDRGTAVEVDARARCYRSVTEVGHIWGRSGLLVPQTIGGRNLWTSPQKLKASFPGMAR